MKITCTNCGTVFRIAENKIPIGRSYVICLNCESRINIFRSVGVGAVLTNLTNLRFLGNNKDLNERFCEPGALWRVVDVVEPCPDKGKGRYCEVENRGRCPNQRLVLRLSRDVTLYKTCLYRGGRRIFDKSSRTPVGNYVVTSDSQTIES